MSWSVYSMACIWLINGLDLVIYSISKGLWTQVLICFFHVIALLYTLVCIILWTQVSCYYWSGLAIWMKHIMICYFDLWTQVHYYWAGTAIRAVGPNTCFYQCICHCYSYWSGSVSLLLMPIVSLLMLMTIVNAYCFSVNA